MVIMSDYALKKPNQIYVYYRVSTRQQADCDRSGLDIQTDECDNYALKIFKVREKDINYYCDIGSTYNNKGALKEQSKMLREMYRDSVLLIHDVSRLGRNTSTVFKFLDKIKKLNCCIISITDNVCFGKTRLLDKKFYLQIVKSEESSDKKSYRMTTYLRAVNAAGGHIGRPPYGYNVQKINGVPRLVKNTEEQKCISYIKKNRNKPLHLIARTLNTSYGLKRGNLWTDATIRSINVNKKIKSYKVKNSSLTSSMASLTV